MVGSGSVLMDQIASTDMPCHLDLFSRRLEKHSHCIHHILFNKFIYVFKNYSGCLPLLQNAVTKVHLCLFISFFNC
jgi:hypothetical protein